MRLKKLLSLFAVLSLILSCERSAGNDPVYWGRSPESSLYVAISRNDIDVVKKIINQDGFNVNKVIGTRYGDQPLHVATYYGRYEIAKLLLEKGADVNAIMPNTSARTPLLTAIWKKHFDVAVLLLKNGADPIIPNLQGESVCEYAKRIGRTEILPHLPNCT
jgi:ankyrin repeat protein